MHCYCYCYYYYYCYYSYSYSYSYSYYYYYYDYDYDYDYVPRSLSRSFVLISMVLQHWSSRLALKPAFNFHLINFLFCCNFYELEASRLV